MKAIILIICCCFTAAAQQSRDHFPKAGPAERISPYKASVYITFERFVIDPNGADMQVLLRLNNNTKWHISVRGNRENKATDVFEVPYLVRRRSLSDPASISETISVGKRKNEVGEIWRVGPNKSILFSVSTTHLTEGSLITVDFSYEWEKSGLSGGDGSINHQALFSFTDMPVRK